MLRVAVGRDRSDTGWSDKISGMEFSSNPGGGAESSVTVNSSMSQGGTGHSRYGTNTILTAPRGHLEHEIDLEAREVGSDMDAAAEKNSLDGTLP
jgi:hypothetical protein